MDRNSGQRKRPTPRRTAQSSVPNRTIRTPRTVQLTPANSQARRNSNPRSNRSNWASSYTQQTWFSQYRPLVVGAAALVVVLILLFAVIIPTCSKPAEDTSAATATPEPTKISFVAVGDNLPDEYIGYFADKADGVEGDDKYDYRPLFEPIKQYIQDADLAYIDQETTIGGNEIGPRGYPSFNTTDEMADAVVDAGFDLVASATNHAYDWGTWGTIPHSLAVWEKQPVAFTGTAATEEQYNRIATMERNGVTFALLNYTYGVNGEKSDVPEHTINFIEAKKIREDVARAKEQADVVIAAMHWGTENLTEADDNQKKWAQLLADLDVDIVIGSHPHVIGPMAWVENSNGSGHQTLVAYSLGNFVADHESPHTTNILEGMLTCDFVKTTTVADDGSESSEITIENPKFVPLVFHSDENRTEFAVYAVSDYPEDLAKKNRLLLKENDPIGVLNDTARSIVGDEWL